MIFFFSIGSSGKDSWAFGVMVFEMQNEPHWRVVSCNSSSERALSACLGRAAPAQCCLARAEHQGKDGSVTHSNPHCSPHCSKQDDLQTSNRNEEDELYARSGTMPGNRERQEQLIALDSNNPKTCPVCRHPSSHSTGPHCPSQQMK